MAHRGSEVERWRDRESRNQLKEEEWRERRLRNQLIPALPGLCFNFAHVAEQYLELSSLYPLAGCSMLANLLSTDAMIRALSAESRYLKAKRAIGNQAERIGRAGRRRRN